jgi:hypothetical protein
MFLVFVGKPKGVLHSTAGYMLYVATTFKYTFDHQAGGGGSSNTHHSFYSYFCKCGSLPCCLPFCTYRPVLWIRIGFNADSDTGFNLKADPDPGSQTSADPDFGQTFRSQKLEFLNEKYTSCR